MIQYTCGHKKAALSRSGLSLCATKSSKPGAYSSKPSEGRYSELVTQMAWALVIRWRNEWAASGRSSSHLTTSVTWSPFTQKNPPSSILAIWNIVFTRGSLATPALLGRTASPWPSRLGLLVALSPSGGWQRRRDGEYSLVCLNCLASSQVGVSVGQVFAQGRGLSECMDCPGHGNGACPSCL